MTLRILEQERLLWQQHPEMHSDLDLNEFVHRLRFFNQNISRARNRSEPKQIEITAIDCVRQAHRQNWLCVITGRPLEFRRGGQYYRGQWRNPNSASIDRLDSDLGYYPSNIQILTDIANCWKSHYTDQELRELSEGYLRSLDHRPTGV